MRRVVGLSVKRGALAAVSLERGVVHWIGRATFTDHHDLPHAIGALAAECPHPPGRIRVVLERDVVQMRALVPAPPIRSAAVRRFVALEAPRLFRRNGAALVTDARVLKVPGTGNVLFAAASAEPLLRAITQGCEQAGFTLIAIGPAADVLPLASEGGAATMVHPDGNGTEILERAASGTWRSRLVRGRRDSEAAWKPPLQALGEAATVFAPAYAAALASPRLSLLPPATLAARRAALRRSALRFAIAACAAWLLAVGVYAFRLLHAERAAGAELARLGPESTRALTLRGDLHAAQGIVELLHRAYATRSRQLGLLARLRSGLQDSVVVVALTVRGDSSLQLSLYAPSATAALAQLERVPGVLRPRLEGPVTRETPGGPGNLAREWERFAVAAELAGSP